MQLPSPAGQSHPEKTAKISHFYASYGNHFDRPNYQDIWTHSFRKSLWSSTFYYLICTWELILAFAIWSGKKYQRTFWASDKKKFSLLLYPRYIDINNFEISSSEPEQKLSQSTNETVPHVKIETIKKF